MSSPIKTQRRARRLIPALAAITATLAIAACGGSSTSTTSTTTSTSASTASASGSSTNRTTLEACLKKHGITAPAHVPSGTSTNHTGTPPAGGFGAGAGNSSARQAAFKACGATGHFGGGSSSTAAGG
jgi:hypothetical protein